MGLRFWISIHPWADILHLYSLIYLTLELQKIMEPVAMKESSQAFPGDLK